ncbi:ComEC/Rec2 family competence protein [Yoonia sediminilitoris]|uniref:Competence protein ComEC n=1 Tax=Yoonia sediminilitoris TaxID=1286148 RepID=A0A2T6KRV4_9RHOB|nr:ComEC/Rec2 family competence protein [Yoonia sediminilitoris]PUB19292.1 competence protein ComEC [Yoonia sediminilitoris]RCW99460.1 competence protein ComEC [Yoonia sediminilitoris]
MIEQTLLAQRGALIGWVPVCLGIGIGLYFSAQQEPDFVLLAGLAMAAVFLAVLWRLVNVAYAPVFMAMILVLTGIGLAKFRTDHVDAPVLGFRYYGPIQGRIVNIDRSASDAPRLTLDHVVLERMSSERTPARVRVSVHGDQLLTSYEPGETLIMTGHLSPPAGPAEPGGFDFQRHAWFLKLGAVGYTRTPVLRWETPQGAGWGMAIFTARMRLSHAVQTAMPGETGAFAAAIMTGDRSAMGQDTLAALRASNLAHLLAISGLHMGLLTGFVFALIRGGLALIPVIALGWPTKKIAAVCALVVGAFYLALSGGNVATERAYIMVGVMFVAVLLDRRALTLRAVAMAAIIILVWQPESLMGPGFQMSFAATTALVAVFGWLRRFDTYKLPKWVQGVMSVVISSAVAGFATAPFAAAHFNQISHYGLIANLLSVPLMGMLVMPAAVLTACLAPIGGWKIGLWFMDLGLRWILYVAENVAGLSGALSHVVAPHVAVLPILTIGLLWAVLWQGRGRYAGGVAVVVALLIWQQSTRPDLLVADNGSLLGLSSDQGRVLSKPTGSSFVAGIWLENDGAPVAQDIAASRKGLQRAGRVVTAHLGPWQITQVSGKTALADLTGCGGADVLISNQEVPEARPCLVFDIKALRNTGSLALSQDATGQLVVTTAHGVAGNRPWNRRQGPAQPPIVLKP